MNLKKCLTAVLFVCAAAVTTAFAPSAASAAPYTYTSEQYGYSIDCPQKPEGVIPASLLYADKKGDVLIFANDKQKGKIANKSIIIKGLNMYLILSSDKILSTYSIEKITMENNSKFCM